MSYRTTEFDGRIKELLQAGGVGLAPSDTIYGLSCLALNQTAVEKLRKLKQREGNKPFIVLISDVEMLDLLSINKAQVEAAKKYWPGPLTLVCESEDQSDWLPKLNNTLAVRMPDHPNLLDFINQVGPLISTSANLAGQPPVQSAQQAYEVFGEQLDFYIDVGEVGGAPSTLVEIKNGKLNVLRQGAVNIEGE